MRLPGATYETCPVCGEESLRVETWTLGDHSGEICTCDNPRCVMADQTVGRDIYSDPDRLLLYGVVLS